MHNTKNKTISLRMIDAFNESSHTHFRKSAIAFPFMQLCIIIACAGSLYKRAKVFRNNGSIVCRNRLVQLVLGDSCPLSNMLMCSPVIDGFSDRH